MVEMTRSWSNHTAAGESRCARLTRQLIIAARYLPDSDGIDRAAMMEVRQDRRRSAAKRPSLVDVASAGRDRNLRRDPRIGAQ